jgi:outer membrane protein assembly factor BamA
MLNHLLFICTVAFLFWPAQTGLLERFSSDRQTSNDGSACAQSATARDTLMREAETNEYHIRRVEFLGNENTRDLVLRQRMGLLQEGELFTRRKLVKSLANVSRLKIIYPVQIADVVLSVDESEKLVDLLICFRERKLAKK